MNSKGAPILRTAGAARRQTGTRRSQFAPNLPEELIPQALRARFCVKLGVVQFEIAGKLQQTETIASGRRVRDRRRLNREYGSGNWRKMKGIATVRLSDGTICEAELHWYEAHGIGKKEIKFKRPVNVA